MTFSSKSVKFSKILAMGNLSDLRIWWNYEKLRLRVPRVSISSHVSNRELQISHFKREYSMFGAFFSFKIRIFRPLLRLVLKRLMTASERQNLRWSWKIQIFRPFWSFFDGVTMNPSKFEVFGTLSQSISEIYFSIKKTQIRPSFHTSHPYGVDVASSKHSLILF